MSIYDEDCDLSPAEYIAHNLFKCWTIEINNIISNIKKREFIRDSTKMVYDDFPIIASLLIAGHPLSPAFRELVIEYIASLDALLAQHAAHEELFDQKDSDILTKAMVLQHKHIFDHYYLDKSERYWIETVKKQFDFNLDHWSLFTMLMLNQSIRGARPMLDDPDELPVKPEQISNLDQYPEFQPKVAPPGSAKADNKSSKADKEDQLIQYYTGHLNLVINWGSYNEFLDAKEIARMAQIKSHMAVSKHPQISEVQSLYNKVVTIIQTVYSAPDVKGWFKAVNDEIANSKARNNQNALKCPIISWSDVTSNGKPKEPILRAIVAVRSLLEDKKLQLRYDVWKSYSVITDENGVEQYQSRQTDSIVREWRNYICERKTIMYSMDVIKDAYHQIAKDNEFHSLQEKIRGVKWDGTDRYEASAKAFGLKTTGEGAARQSG